MKNIVLVSRENINCSNLSVNEFVRMMFSDIIEAEENYNELYVPEYISCIINDYNRYLNSYRNKAIKYAEKKWKTEKYRNSYIENEVNNARKKYNINRYYNHIAFFDLNIHPESNGHFENCCFSINSLTFDFLEKCFNKIKDNYYFKNALGWKLVYECNDNSYSSSFRPYVKLILPDNIQAKYDKAAKDLAEDIARFYENCRYWGD